MGLIAVQSPIKTRSLQNPLLEIRGGRRLSGELQVSGAKNSALVLMAACLLTRDTIRLRNVPPLTDIAAMSEILVGSVEQAASSLGMSSLFVGVIVV